MLVLFSATWGKHANTAAASFVTARLGLNRSRTRRGAAKLLPLVLPQLLSYETQHLRFFYLHVIDLHGILFIESL
jgi:hypothetical protein